MPDDLELEKILFTLAKKKPDQFPGGNGTEYVGRYQALRATFQREYQSWIDAALGVKEGILFTSHGPDHFKTVIDRAFGIMTNDPVPLSGYETYVLLIAIHLHDVGNLFGRSKHEKECKQVIHQLGSLLSQDEPEKRLFYDVAMAHGGKIENNKDTIRTIRQEVQFRNQPVHLRKLAGILRLADELADDYSRVSGALVKFGITDSVYHYYARGLQSVVINARLSKVELHFSFPKSLLLSTQRKDDNDQVWLFDEILKRCLKTFLEMRYTSQYMRTIEMNELYVHIEWQTEFDAPIEEVSFTFESLGFPSISDVYNLVPKLQDYPPWGRLSGATLATRLGEAEAKTQSSRPAPDSLMGPTKEGLTP